MTDWYFAYANDANPERLRKDHPRILADRPATLAGHRLVFAGPAQNGSGGEAAIEPSPGDEVLGTAYQVDAETLGRLVASANGKALVEQTIRVDGGPRQAKVLVAAAAGAPAAPTDAYLGRVREGLTYFYPVTVVDAYLRRAMARQPIFADIQAYLLGLEPPKYPFPIDGTLAVQGGNLFGQHCAKCHGTYGKGGEYPSKVVPLDIIGTDRRLAEGTAPAFADHYLKSWFAQETGPDGQPFALQTIRGYQAPPLDGVWATAPYFHNGSVPTVYHVLNSKARPKIFTRSYRTEEDSYDTQKLGWKISVQGQPLHAKMSALDRRKIYDTTQPGRSNSGHVFGDVLTEEERTAVIEYLKTL